MGDGAAQPDHCRVSPLRRLIAARAGTILPAAEEGPAVPPGADPAWFTPPVEHTLLDSSGGDGVTEVTRLPPRLDDPESTIEHRPAV